LSFMKLAIFGALAFLLVVCLAQAVDLDGAWNPEQVDGNCSFWSNC